MQRKKIKKSMVIRYDYLEQFGRLSSADFGDLMRAVLRYSRDGILPEFESEILTLSFSIIKVQVDHDEEKYMEKCERQKRNIKKRWSDTKNTTVYQRIPTDTKHTDGDCDCDCDKVNTLKSKSKDSCSTAEPPSDPEPVPVVSKSHRRPKPVLTAAQQERFDRFWQAFPKKVSKGQALKTWAKLNPDDVMLDRMLQAILLAQQQDKRFSEPEFTPHPSTWLNAMGWEDVPDTSQVRGGNYTNQKPIGRTVYEYERNAASKYE